MTETKAPERIWVCPDLIVPQDENGRVIEGKAKYPDWSCGTFWDGDPSDYPHGQTYTRSDIHADLIKAAHELADALSEIVREGVQEAESHEDYIRDEGNHAQLEQAEFNAARWRKAASALSDFNKARGETQ